jgi:hypothetical protein
MMVDSSKQRTTPIIKAEARVSEMARREADWEARRNSIQAIGEDIRLSNLGLTGAALAARGRVIHLSAFAV